MLVLKSRLILSSLERVVYCLIAGVQWNSKKRKKKKKKEKKKARERTCVFLWLTCRRVWVRVLFQTDVFPQCISYVVHTLLAAKGQSIEWRRKHAETAYTVITLNLFIGHFVFFCLCQVCCDINNGTTGIDMTCANSNGYLEKRRVNTVDQVAIDSLLSQYAFVWRQEERRDDSGLFHDPQIFFYKFKSDDSIHCWITL